MIGRTSHYLPKATSLFCAGGRPFFASFENRGYRKKCLGRVGDPRKYCACQQTFHKSRQNAGVSAICEKFAGMRSTLEGSQTARGTFFNFWLEVARGDPGASGLRFWSSRAANLELIRGCCKKCLGRFGNPRKYCACQQTFYKSRQNVGVSAICGKFAGRRSTWEGSQTTRKHFLQLLGLTSSSNSVRVAGQ